MVVMDCVSDNLFYRRRFQISNAMDDFNREVLATEIDLNLQEPRVIRALERLIA
jgi:putative transposase